jgi:hypothetical protein
MGLSYDRSRIDSTMIRLYLAAFVFANGLSIKHTPYLK